MEARINSLIVILLSLTGSACVCFAQVVEGPPPPTTTQDANAPDMPVPYVAEITGDNVYVRSGPGTNYYPCGRLNKGDTVTVVGRHFPWSRIVPPPGSFSWISARHIQVDPNDRNSAIVVGNAVRVYVGSESLDPIRSTRDQLRLNRGERVKLLGEKKNDYYQIDPPVGAYRWVSTEYTKAVRPVGQIGPVPAPAPAPAPAPVPAPAPNDTNAVVPPSLSVEAEKLQEYYALQERIQIERAKPPAQQDYTSIKNALLKIAADKQAGKAARYAEFGLRLVERCELALEVARTVRLQDDQSKKIKEDIANARESRLGEVPNLGRFAVVGRLQVSKVYLKQTYRVLDDSGKIICYALPASKMNLTRFVGRKVGLVGKIEPNKQIGGALVRFTEVVELK